jgi:hypothetical protein
MLPLPLFPGYFWIWLLQVVMPGRCLGRALFVGVAGTLKNVLPILLLAMVVFAGFLAFALALAMVISLLGMVGGLVHPALAVLLAAPVYLGGLLMLYVVMFGVMYFMWRDVCGEAAPLPPGQVEL